MTIGKFQAEPRQGQPRFLPRRSEIESLNELDHRGRLRLQHAFHDQLATRIHPGKRDGGLMNVHADILFLTHKGAPFR